jgi:hypothetical protein
LRFGLVDALIAARDCRAAPLVQTALCFAMR